MKQPKRGKIRNKFINTWITSLISITMVLILLGLLGFIIINSGRLADYVREKIGFTVVLNDNLNEADILKFQKTLATRPFVKSYKYIDKETAAKELSHDLGEDFKGFLGFNPLFSSIEIKFFANYTNPDSLTVIEKSLMTFPEVKEVFYQKNLLSLINENIKKISLFLLVISGLLIFIFVSLIHNTIRISIYAQRFTINTMQLVGASNSFIRKPFIQRSILIGLYGALLANIVIISGIFSIENELEGIISLNDYNVLVAVPVLILFLGIIISWFSTWFVINKFLRMKFDELFY